MERHADPAALVAVRYDHNGQKRTAHVLAAAVADGRRYLNTYSRNGALKTSRGCTVPISSGSIQP